MAIAGMPLWAAAVVSNALLFLLIGGMAGSCDADQLRRKFTTRAGGRGILAGVCCQFVLLPLMGFIALTLFPQSSATSIALLVVTTSPGGGFSGFWCFLCNADLALSVAMTTASTLVSIVALPLNLALYITLMYGVTVRIDYPSLLTSCAVVIAAVFAGYSLSRALPTQRQAIATTGQTAGVALMVFGALANGSSEKGMFWNNEPAWFAAVCLPVFGGLLTAMAIGRLVELPNPQAVAVAIECCYQNTGLALTIALSAMAPEDVGEASGVPLAYGTVEILLIPLFALTAWRMGWTYAPPTDNVCKVLVGNYQPAGEAASNERGLL